MKDIGICSNCITKVLPKSDGTCPSCGHSFQEATREQILEYKEKEKSDKADIAKIHRYKPGIGTIILIVTVGVVSSNYMVKSGSGYLVQFIVSFVVFFALFGLHYIFYLSKKNKQ